MEIISKGGIATGIPQFSDYLAAPAVDHPIHITSGEGELGTTEIYTGKRTERAIKLRLARERCGGDRWARAEIYMHTSVFDCEIGMNCEDGVVGFFPEIDE